MRISTGAALPGGADRVVMQEEAVRTGDAVRVGPAGDSQLRAPPRRRLRQRRRAAHAGTRLDPWRIALAASAGCASVAVSVRPRIAIVVTGDELASPGTAPGAWQIHDSVGPALAAWFAAAGVP